MAIDIEWEWLTEEQQARVKARTLELRGQFIQFALAKGVPPMEVVAWGADPTCAGMLNDVCQALAFEEYKREVREHDSQGCAGVSQDE